MGERKHFLKAWPEPWFAVRDGSKTFEVREDDRGYAVGDMLILKLWCPFAKDFVDPDTMESPAVGDSRKCCIHTRVTYILHGGRFGLPSGLCVMGIEVLSPTPGTGGTG